MDVDAEVVSNANVTQGSEQWHRARLGKVTSSCFGKVMSKARSGGGMSQTAATYLTQLVGERLTGRPAEEISSKYIDHGNKYEPVARSLYQFQANTDLAVVQTGFIDHPEIPMCGGSPDSLVGDVGLNEIKCPFNMANHLKVIEADVVLDPMYRWQCQGNIWVTQREWIDYVSFCPYMPWDLQLHVMRVYRNEDMIEELEERIPQFLEQIEIKIDKIKNNIRSTWSDQSGEEKESK